MKRFLLVCLFVCFVPCALASGQLALSENQINILKKYYPDDQHAPILWKGDPLAIVLPIGKEKRLIFPEPIQADLNSQLTTAQLRIINSEKSLYLTAHTSFPPTRLYVTLKNSREIVLIDLSTEIDASNAKQVIVVTSKRTSTQHTPESSHLVTQVNSADSFVNAIRFAWRHTYAPEQVTENTLTFERTPMHVRQWENSLIYGDKVLAHPIASWQNNGIYVTAVELRNKYSHPTLIQPAKDICGHWRAAVLYPRQSLQPSGDVSGDSTTLFLISSHPVGEVLKVCHGSA